MDANHSSQARSAGPRRIGLPALLVLLVGAATTLVLFVLALESVRDSERSLVRQHSVQTFGVIQTVAQQVEAIVSAGAAAAQYSGGNPVAFRRATALRVETSLFSSLSLLELRPGGIDRLATVGISRPLLLGRLTPADDAEIATVAKTGADITYVTGAPYGKDGRVVGFAVSPQAGSRLVVWGEIAGNGTGRRAPAAGVETTDLRFAIYLGGRPLANRLLLASPDGVPTGSNVEQDVIGFGNTQLLVTLGPRHRLVSEITWVVPWLVLALGLVETVAIAVLVERGRRRRDEALQLVGDLERRTQELDEALAEQRRAEEEARTAAERLRHGQRMEAIGRLAGGVAHDFNNLLTAIIGSTRLLLRNTRPGDSMRSGLEDVERAADRAATLTRQLLAFSRKQVLQPAVVDVNRIVRETETLLRHLIRADVRLEIALEPRLVAVEADASQLEQVIVNLVVNAADAIEGGGTIAIATANAAGPDGPSAMLSVADDGIGMDEATRERVFEPFFTTKELGRGTGLGLATVYGIVEQSGGSIEVESEPGLGATFRVYLPAVDAEIEEPAPPEPRPESTTGTETVVVAEDDEMVRALVRVTLEESGYRVLEAASGEAALVLCDSFPGPIDVLVTDMVMPGMGGRALADRLQASRPELRVLYVSGYAEAEVLDRGLGSGAEPGTAFVQKPFTPEELALRIRTLIDRPRAATGAHAAKRTSI
jgi:signal transduction histidine kinase/FixJ family two-component response regulator